MQRRYDKPNGYHAPSFPQFEVAEAFCYKSTWGTSLAAPISAQVCDILLTPSEREGGPNWDLYLKKYQTIILQQDKNGCSESSAETGHLIFIKRTRSQHCVCRTPRELGP